MRPLTVSLDWRCKFLFACSLEKAQHWIFITGAVSIQLLFISKALYEGNCIKWDERKEHTWSNTEGVYFFWLLYHPPSSDQEMEQPTCLQEYVVARMRKKGRAHLFACGQPAPVMSGGLGDQANESRGSSPPVLGLGSAIYLFLLAAVQVYHKL